MAISIRAQKTLWGRAAGRCSYPGCRLNLFFDEAEADDPTHVGENCHIVSEADNGPRAEPTMPQATRDSYANLILLCRNHHRVIDDVANGERDYPVERLHEIKRSHEAWVRDQLEFDAAKQRDDEIYATIIDEWERRADLDRWMAWSSRILSHGQPRMRVELSDSLHELRRWLLTRIWPERYGRLESAFENFRRVLEIFHNTFLEKAEARGDLLVTEKFYKIPQWDEKLYRRLLKEYEFHVDLVQDLMLELTRAANLVCDAVREFILFGYRRDQGRLMVQSGPLSDLSFRDFVVQYRGEERKAEIPFNGLGVFLTERSQRDDHFGEGTEPAAE